VSTPAQIFAANERINQIILEELDPAAWKATPPGKVRSIAAIFSHMHNMRAKWVRLSAPHLGTLPQLARSQCTLTQMRAALGQSASRCQEMLMDPQVKKFHRDGWAPSWPVGPEMLCYMLMHESHHRGQICMLAHQLGFPLPVLTGAALWNWEKIWKQCGFSAGPGR
jgi:uncharacterized damage-inducible protein DinB